MDAITEQLADFISQQPMFFVATAAADGRVNVSPKGMETLRVVEPGRIVWLNLSGSGNETAAHVRQNGRMTLMWCSYSEMPLIVRVYGTARAIHPRDSEWTELAGLFAELGGSRQIFDLAVDQVATSCGTGVPVMSLEQVRGYEELEPYYAKMSPEELRDYWTRKNVESIDGYPTGIFSD